MIVLIDNYDSFSYNLVQCIEKLGYAVSVFKHDAITIEELRLMLHQIDAIVISPGPGNPSQSGISKELIKTFYEQKKILGVCLGHQCIGEVFGAQSVHAAQIYHGKTSAIKHWGRGIFADLPNPMTVARYHSLTSAGDNISSEIEIVATNEDQETMAFAHKNGLLWGVQFHPESFMTPDGEKLMKNFLEL